MEKRKTDSIHPFFKKKTETVKWKIVGSLLIGNWGNIEYKSKVACFDFDGTIAGVQGTHIYPKHGNDWVWTHAAVPNVIKHFHDNGYSIVIMSNQSGILNENPKSKKRKDAFMGRIQNVVSAIQNETDTFIPIRIYAATSDDFYRKPRRGMWTELEKEYEQFKKPLELSKCFYVGDAAGRPHHWVNGHIEDHADTDFKFSLNANLKFYVPEHIFHPSATQCNDAQDKEIPVEINLLPVIPNPFHASQGCVQSLLEIPQLSENLEIVVFVGPPASGKSFHYQKYFSKKFRHVNQDTLKTKAHCLKKTNEYLDSGESVVIDNTNPDKATRADYISIAKSRNIPIHCVYFDVSPEICRHNNEYREFYCKSKKKVPSVAYHSFYSRLQVPTLEEGFDTVLTMHWTPQFENVSDEHAWKLYYS